jgi:hypothetical protein
MRAAQLQKEPLCEFCLAKGRHVPAIIVDHIKPHRLDPKLLWCTGQGLRSLCWSCHSGEKAVIERRGYSDAIGVDGWPVDRAHPVYQTWAAKGGEKK